MWRYTTKLAVHAEHHIAVCEAETHASKCLEIACSAVSAATLAQECILNRKHSEVIATYADLAQNMRSLGITSLIIGALTTPASKPFWRDFVIVLDGNLSWKGSTSLVLC